MNVHLIEICEDDVDLSASICELITSEGYSARCSSCAEDLDMNFSHRPPDALLLDLRLPGENGRSIATRYRKLYPSLPIIMMSVEGATEDRIAGYESGAMLYLPKPFEPEALLACLKGLFASKTSAEGLRLKLSTRELISQNTITISEAECKLIRLLAVRSPEVIEYWELMECLGYNLEDDKKSNLEVVISRLRKKLRGSSIEREQLQIVAKHQVGYALIGNLEIIS